MLRLFPLVKFTLIALAAITLAAGCGDTTRADELVAEGEELRRAATDTLRRQTAAVDAMSATLASGDSLLVNEVETSAETIASEYAAAAADLENRRARLEDAVALDVDDTYKEYLALLSASNDELLAAITAAGEITDLILADRQALAGWDEVRAAEVVDEIAAIQIRVDELYDASETLRIEAEQLREDNPDSFG